MALVLRYSFIPGHVGGAVALICGIFMKVMSDCETAWADRVDLTSYETTRCTVMQYQCRYTKQDLHKAA